MLKGSLAALVAVLALGVFLLLRQEGFGPEAATAARDEVSASDAAAPDLVRPQTPAATRVETTASEPPPLEPPVPPDPLASRRDVPAEGEGTLIVTVVDGTGAPLPGAKVWLQLQMPDELLRLDARGDPLAAQPTMAWFREWREQGRRVAARTATTDGSGTAVLAGLPWGRIVAKASTEGLAPGDSQGVTLSEQGPEARVEVVLEASGHVAGELRDIHGAPAEGITLFISRLSPDAARRFHRTTHTTTDALGAFAFHDLAVGTWSLRADPMGRAPAAILAQEVDVEVLAGRTTFVSLPETGGTTVQVSGLVLRNGRPLAGAMLHAAPDEPRPGRPGSRGTTDDEGRFELLLEQGGAWRFFVFVGPQQGGLSQTLTIPQAPRHEVVLDFSTGSLSGRVLGPDGEAVAGANVMAFSERSGGVATDAGGMGTTTSDAEGRYALVDLPAGTYRVQAHPAADGASPFWGVGSSPEVALAAGAVLTDVDVLLAAGGSIGGRVLLDGEGIAGASIELRGRRGGKSARSDDEGRYELRGAEEGTAWVRATREGWTSPWTSVVARAGSAIALDLALAAGARVVVELDDADGPVEQAFVWLEGADERTGLAVLVRNGRGATEAVPAGTYRVVARRDWREKDPARHATTTITVFGGEERVVRLRLP